MIVLNDATEAIRRLFARRQDADATLTDPGILAALADVRAAAMDTFAASAPSQSAERENAYWMLRALDGVEHALANAVAAHELDKRMREHAEDVSARFLDAGGRRPPSAG